MKICPFERQNRGLCDTSRCLRESCAWWDDEIEKCIVFRHFADDTTESFQKEIETVLFGQDPTGLIVQGGED